MRRQKSEYQPQSIACSLTSERFLSVPVQRGTSVLIRARIMKPAQPVLLLMAIFSPGLRARRGKETEGITDGKLFLRI